MIKTRAELEQILIKLEPKLRQEFGLLRIGYFGSFSRNEQRKKSDVDIIYNTPNDSLGLTAELRQFLKNQTGRHISFVHADNIREEYKAGILEDSRFLENGLFSGGHDFSQDPNRKIRRKKMDDAYLNDILESMKRVVKYVDGIRLWEYRKNEVLIDAVERRFQILGEAIKKLSPQLKQRYTEIPWQHWADFRNNVVHDYEADYTQKVWDDIHNLIEPIIPQIQKIVKAECE